MSTTLPILNCDDCGACCMEMNSPPFIGPTDPEVRALPAEVQQSYEDGMERRELAGWPDGVPCFWLDLKTKRCKNYEHRPEICREFEVGGEGCLTWREQLT